MVAVIVVVSIALLKSLHLKAHKTQKTDQAADKRCIEQQSRPIRLQTRGCLGSSDFPA